MKKKATRTSLGPHGRLVQRIYFSGLSKLASDDEVNRNKRPDGKEVGISAQVSPRGAISVVIVARGADAEDAARKIEASMDRLRRGDVNHLVTAPRGDEN